MTQKKILLIDDDRVIYELAAGALSNEGFIVITAENPPPLGIQAVLEQNTDIMLLDVLLPDFGGYQVCQQLRPYLQLSICPLLCSQVWMTPNPLSKTIIMGQPIFFLLNPSIGSYWVIGFLLFYVPVVPLSSLRTVKPLQLTPSVWCI